MHRVLGQHKMNLMVFVNFILVFFVLIFIFVGFFCFLYFIVVDFIFASCLFFGGHEIGWVGSGRHWERGNMIMKKHFN